MVTVSKELHQTLQNALADAQRRAGAAQQRQQQAEDREACGGKPERPERGMGVPGEKQANDSTDQQTTL